MVCRILVPQLGIGPQATAVKTLFPNHWTAMEFPRNILSGDLTVDCQKQMNLKYPVQHGYVLCYFTVQLCQGTVK